MTEPGVSGMSGSRKEEEEWSNLPILQTQPPQRVQKTTLLPLIIIIIITDIIITDIIIILTASYPQTQTPPWRMPRT